MGAMTGRFSDEAWRQTADMRAAMLAAFARSAQYEYLFWDGAYKRRGWPIVGASGPGASNGQGL
jgi:hypothetical protein